jgi:pimeloyl-ACP methyl ester carboxylesterase
MDNPVTDLTNYKDAVNIQVAERDFKLELDRVRWPGGFNPPQGWKKDSQSLYRTIVTGSDPEEENQLACPIKESILRFPSAPIHGLHRFYEYHVNDKEGESENLHTYRVLSHPGRPATPARRIFLMHNGLNETLSMSLYYRLASQLIDQDPDGTVCLLRPFPGHLSRSRFYRFAETPLDHYLWDGSQLFRQFLRYMVETQWLLSVIARRSSYRCISGLDLLAESEDVNSGRLSNSVLAEQIEAQWTRLHGASKPAVSDAQLDQTDAIDLKDPPDSQTPFREAVAGLRRILHLKEKLTGDIEPDDAEPAVHVVGYSLGGFTAQSVFMSWPFLVSSCSTLLSGGALRELAPTAFADPEEWQTVLHSLRYELDNKMMEGAYAAVADSKSGGEYVAGMELDLFLFLKSTFYEVFQQEYRGSFQTRLAAFRRRMLFIVGGNDPIVRTQSVLDSGPPDGINMVAIGGLGHFLGSRAQDEEEEEQRSFWLPQIGKLVSEVADEAEHKQDQQRGETWLDSEMHVLPLAERSESQANGNGRAREGTGRLDISERLAVDGDGALPGPLFERCLDDLLVRAHAKRGILFILRNEVPTVLLPKDAIREHAAALHHDDAGIVKYIDGLARRRRLIYENRERISLIVPWNAKGLMERMDPDPGHPSQAEAAGGQMPKWARAVPEETWDSFKTTCAQLTGEDTPDTVRVCEGGIGLEQGGTPKLELEQLVEAARKKLYITDENQAVTPSLPDCWLWISPKFLLLDDEDPLEVSRARRELCDVVPDRYLDPDRLVNALRKEQLRLITVSRARYNPRFRGRIVADPKAAGDLLLHATLCIAASFQLEDYDLDGEKLRAEVAVGR